MTPGRGALDSAAARSRWTGFLALGAFTLLASSTAVRADHVDGMTLMLRLGTTSAVTLDWTGGQPTFRVYRSTSPQSILDAGNLVGTSIVRTFDDTPPSGAAFFYEIASPCVYAPPEICNGLDDDCDGAIDEAGAEASCSLTNASPVCTGGACHVGQCAPGYGDCDGSAADGCESTLDTSSNCGVCGHVCVGGQSCGGGACICPMGQVPSPTGCSNVATRTVLSVGNSGACAVLSDGGVACWGRNHYGEMGLESPDNATHGPARVVTLGGAISVGIRNTFACAITAAGNVRCWGSNGLGELGDETTNARAVPAPVHGPAPGQILSGVTALAVGDNHACAIKSPGVVYCWGANSTGQLGDGTAARRAMAAPIQNPSGSLYVALAAGPAHTCALTTTGNVDCWGANDYGQLNGGANASGNPLFAGPGTWTPIRITTLANVRALSAGERHNCALLADGSETCWGEKEKGSTYPQAALGGLIAVAAGGGQSCALSVGGQTSCWGSNLDFQLGSLAPSIDGGTPTMTTSAVPIPLANVVAVAAGPRTTCVSTAGGQAFCWGGNFAGEAGNGLSRGSGDFLDMPNWIVDAARPFMLPIPGAVASPTGGSGGGR
jgi:alpha-tubulin suppressor-like RCC1 family protein